MTDTITTTKVTCSKCATELQQDRMAIKDKRNGRTRFKSWCKPCDAKVRSDRRAAKDTTIVEHLHYRMERSATYPEKYDEYGNTINKIQFLNGDYYTAVGESHLLTLAAMPGLPEGVRVHFAALAKLSPFMCATFGRGELSRITGIETKNLARALKQAADMGLTDELSTTSTVWVNPDHGQRSAVKYRGELPY